jgi:hypothetical protein
MGVVDMCMLSNSHQGSFQISHDNMSVSNLFVRLDPTNKLSNFVLYNNLVNIRVMLVVLVMNSSNFFFDIIFTFILALTRM